MRIERRDPGTVLAGINPGMQDAHASRVLTLVPNRQRPIPPGGEAVNRPPGRPIELVDILVVCVIAAVSLIAALFGGGGDRQDVRRLVR